MSAILHRSMNARPPVVAEGNGVWLRDKEGKEYLDAVSGGVGVSCIGHRNSRVAAAIGAQIAAVPYAHTLFFTSEPAEGLAELLVEHAPAGMESVLFCSGGSEAIEAALKLVRQTWIERGRPNKSKIISRRQSYHGATVGALSIGGNAGRREIYAPMLFEGHFIDPCYAYKYRRDDESAEAYGVRAANALEAEIQRVGEDNIAAFFAETVVGATSGCVPAEPGYLRRIREICDRYDVLLVLDEIMSGMGRTGYTFACLEDGVTPDLITIAKGLGGGFAPIGGVVVSSVIASALREGSGALKHGFTYMAHPMACAAALEVQRIILEEHLMDNVREQGARLRHGLEAVMESSEYIGDVRGRGLFIGVELVADKRTKSPFDAKQSIAQKLRLASLEQGLMIYPGSGTRDGATGDHVLFAPAFTVTSDEIDEIVRRFSLALHDVLADAVKS